MRSTEVSVERRLTDLGWSGVPLPTVLAEMLWLFVTAGLETAEVVRRMDGLIGDVGDDVGDGTGDCIRAIGIFLDTAERSGNIECLCRPGTRELLKVLDALARWRGAGGE